MRPRKRTARPLRRGPMPSEDELRLARAAIAVTGMEALVDVCEDFPQVDSSFPSEQAFDDFVKSSGSEELGQLLALHRQQIAFVALRAVYNDLKDAEKCRQLNRTFCETSFTISERQDELARERALIGPDLQQSLYAHMSKVMKLFRPWLRISYEDRAVCALILSLLTDPVESSSFEANIKDPDSLIRAVRAAMADLAPMAEKYREK